MFNPTHINPDFVLIKIDRERQYKKREKIGSFFIPPGSIHMQHNQQCGEIIMIGDRCKQLIPETEIGDQLLFHHSVEGSVMTQKEREAMKTVPVNNWLVYDNPYTDPFLYYIVRKDFIYGVKKQNGEMHMHPDIVFAIPDESEQDNRDLKRVGHILLFKNFKQEREDIQRKIDYLKKEAETHPQRAATIMVEMEKLTKSLNKKRAGKFIPVFVSKKIAEDIGHEIDMNYTMWYEFLGSSSTVPQVTTIQIEDDDKPVTFYVLRRDYILMVRKKNKSKLELIA